MPTVSQSATELVALEIAAGDELSLGQISREKQLEPSTIGRWITKGLPSATGGRVRLCALRRGKKWVTSRAALARFFASLPASPSVEPDRGRQPTVPGDRSMELRDEQRRQAVVERISKYGY